MTVFHPTAGLVGPTLVDGVVVALTRREHREQQRRRQEHAAVRAS